MLGGSSGLNLMAWTRASQAEYDAFDKFAPGHGWTFKDLLPFLKKVENVDKQSNPFPGISSAALSNAVQTGPLFAGSAGPINVIKFNC